MTEFALTKHPAMILAPGASKQVGDRVTETTGANSRVLLVCDPALVELGLAFSPVKDLFHSWITSNHLGIIMARMVGNHFNGDGITRLDRDLAVGDKQ